MDKRDKGYTLYKKGLSCTEISKKLDVSINTVKSWRKRYWTQGADAPAKRTLHPEDAPAAPDPETRPKQGAPPGNVNAVGAGAPKGNRNAVKHGGWSELMFRSWTEEHRQLLDACDEDVDAEELLINELKLLTAREGYLLERISHYSKEGAYVQTQTTSKRSRNFKRLDGDAEKEKNDLQAQPTLAATAPPLPRLPIISGRMGRLRPRALRGRSARRPAVLRCPQAV